jgi:hypothetical protein
LNWLDTVLCPAAEPCILVDRLWGNANSPTRHGGGACHRVFASDAFSPPLLVLSFHRLISACTYSSLMHPSPNPAPNLAAGRVSHQYSHGFTRHDPRVTRTRDMPYRACAAPTFEAQPTPRGNDRVRQASGKSDL